ncbi:MAG: hypothetical protein HW419_2242 [Deltaproteobacteria bacterium]|nr:hypothetical protein [Deltaproteobacteria bacterium]
MDTIAAGGDPIGMIRDAAKHRILEINPGEFKLNGSTLSFVKRNKPCCHAKIMTC